MDNMKVSNQAVVVQLNDLAEGMLINEYIGFDSKYENIGTETRDWLKLNFKGARVAIQRGDSECHIDVEELKEGDSLIRIFKLPFGLMSIRKVNDKLINELNSRGFSRFIVKFSPGLAPKTKKKILSDNTNQFIAGVKEGITARNKAISIAEKLIDTFRDKEANLNVVNVFVSDIIEKERSDKIAAVLSLIENDHVYAHSVDVGVIFQQVYFKMIEMEGRTSVFKDKREAMLGAFLHDIGKSKLPKEIVDSKAAFDKDGDEMKTIRQHPGFGAEILKSMGMPDYIVNMANYHHVKLDTTMNSSYPPDVNYDDVIYETKLLALVDVYQALVSGRSYKRSWTPPAVMRYLDAMAGVEFEVELWQSFLSVMGLYPVGSLVKLSDGSLAFVVSVPDEEPTRPLVAVVQNEDGVNLKSQLLIDLSEELTLSIVKDIDSQEIFQEKALDAFIGITIS